MNLFLAVYENNRLRKSYKILYNMHFVASLYKCSMNVNILYHSAKAQ